jgi:hypothetical protein
VAGDVVDALRVEAVKPWQNLAPKDTD